MGIILSTVAAVKRRRHKKKKGQIVEPVKTPGEASNSHHEEAQGVRGELQSLRHSSTIEWGSEQERLSARQPPSKEVLAGRRDLELQGEKVRQLEREQVGKQAQDLAGARTGEEPEVQRNVGIRAPDPLTVTDAKTPPTHPSTETSKEDKMASDEDYASFLDKANQDPNEGSAQSKSGKIELKSVDSGVEVPKGLKEATKDAWYTSDADEKFTPVALKFSGKSLPDEATFAKTAGHPSPKEADVQIMDIGEWDPQGEYKDVVEAVRAAGKGSDVRVYRIARDGTRVEYWVVTIEGGKLVGAKVLAVES